MALGNAQTDIKAVITADDRASKTLKNFGDNTVKESNRMVVAAKSAGLALLKVGAVAAAAATAAASKFILWNGAMRALNIEDAKAKLKGLGHSVASVTEIMDSALAAVKGTAYGLDSAATIAASAVAAGVKPGKELTKYLKLTADAATIAGSSLDDMGSIINKVTTGQKAYTQEINQLSDRGLPIWKWLQKEYNTTAVGLRKMVADGEVDSATFRKVIEENIGGAALASGSTTRGAWANMQAAMARVGAAITDRILPKIREALGDATKWFDENAQSIVDFSLDAMHAIGEFGESAIKVARQVGDYLLPKLKVLWESIDKNIIPILKDLWKNVIEPLIPVIGVALVVAIGAAVDAIKIASDIIGGFYGALKDGNPLVWALVGALGGLATALAINKAITAFTVALNIMTTSTIPGVIGKMTALKLLVSTPMVMPAIAIGAAMAALGTLFNETQKTIKAINGATNSFKKGLDEKLDLQKKLIRQVNDSVSSPSQKKLAKDLLHKMGTPGFATGGFTGKGGANEVAGVVHKGEFVLPKSQVDQSTGTPKGMGGNVSVNVNIGLYAGTEMEKRKIATDLFRSLQDVASSKGMTVNKMMGI